MTDLLPVVEAQQRILAAFQPVDTTTVPLTQAAGRVLCEDISADRDLPPFTSSSMDGFAVQAADTLGAGRETPVALKVVAEIPAGSFPTEALRSGQAARIMTGAALPEGADAVIPVEETTADDDEVRLLRAVKAGDYLRPRGMDLSLGMTVLHKSRRLLPQDIGLLATLGIANVPVYRKPRVALFSSGDELVQPGQPLGPGQIYDSNSYTLAGLVQEQGCELLPLGVVRDDPLLVSERLQEGVRQGADLIITSAGVSVGAFDYVRAILQEQGTLTLWRVNMRPGKPLAFGSFHGVPVVGLPGNPVSAFVGFLIFVAPVLRRLAGLPDALPRREKAILTQAIESDGRESYLRAVVQRQDGRTTVALAGNQSSANLYTLVQANALLIVPSGVKSLPVGAEAEIVLLGREIE